MNLVESLCISFALQGPVPSSIPSIVNQEIKEFISQQYSARFSPRSISFDDSRCSEVGQYEFSEESITLRSNGSSWEGQRDFLLNDVLSGKSLNFIAPKLSVNPEKDLVSIPLREDGIKTRRVLRWSWMISLAALVSAAIVKGRSGASTPQDNTSVVPSVTTTPTPSNLFKKVRRL